MVDCPPRRTPRDYMYCNYNSTVILHLLHYLLWCSYAIHPPTKLPGLPPRQTHKPV
ncbi:Protein of unknown function [Mycobacterium canettii CIPT 140070010]|nr:Protein of unknown function [Mycobacterium canettii CIPT 140070010]